MDTKVLYYFTQIHRYGSMSQAANHLFISQQGLSAIMSRFEKELGCKLFRRTSQGVQLTVEGRYLLPRAERILEITGEISQYLGKKSDSAQTLRVGCAFGVYNGVARKFLAAFQAEYPDLQIDIREYPDLLCEEALKNHEIDLAFSPRPINPAPFEISPLEKQPFSIIIHQSSPFFSLKKLRLQQLEKQPFVLLNNHFHIHYHFIKACNLAGFSPQIQSEVAEIALIHRIVEKGEAIGLGTSSVYGEYIKPDVKLIPLVPPELIWDICFIERKKDLPTRPAAALKEFILKKNR